MTGTSRRTLLKQSAALGLSGMLPQVVEGTPDQPTEAITPTAATGTSTTYIMRGYLSVEGDYYIGRQVPLYYREITFTVNHHEHFRDDTVDVVVENPLRPQDMFDFRQAPWQKLTGVLAEIHDYASEQARREWEDA